MSACDHRNFQVSCGVLRMTEREEQPGESLPVIDFQAEVGIACLDCGEAFAFLAPVGLSFTSPTVSADGLMLRAPIRPKSWGTPLDRPLGDGAGEA